MERRMIVMRKPVESGLVEDERLKTMHGGFLEGGEEENL